MEEMQVEQAQPSAWEDADAPNKKQKKKRLSVLLGPAAVLLVAVVIAAAVGKRMKDTAPEGCYGYTVQKQQYYVEYSEQYDYLDVLTIEYPVLEEAEDAQGQLEHLQQINDAFYETAMDRVNYWHLRPDEEVKRAQEAYHMFTADVQCEVPYHSQYLVSAHFRETYSPVYPVWYIFTTQRGMTADLLTGSAMRLRTSCVWMRILLPCGSKS